MDGEDDRVDAIVVRRESEVLVRTIDKHLTVGAGDVPVVGKAVKRAGIAEDADQGNLIAFVDRQRSNGIHHWRGIGSRYGRGSRGAAAVIHIGHREMDGVGALIQRSEAEVLTGAVGHVLPIAASDLPAGGIGVPGYGIAEAPVQCH